MSHTQLMISEWVVDDVLTAKLKVEVRHNYEHDQHILLSCKATYQQPRGWWQRQLHTAKSTGAGSTETHHGMVPHSFSKVGKDSLPV